MMPRQVKGLLRRALMRLGYRVVRADSPDGRYVAPSFNAMQTLPPGADAHLRGDHPRLLELRRRYAAAAVPMARHTLWNAAYLERELDLRHFRGDNAYVWQFRNVRGDERRKYYLFAKYVEALDSRGLLRQLREDGAFGCWTFQYESLPLISRDLLDSINEMYFLDRHWGLFGRGGFTMLDIGAGYGRLADRIVAATDVMRYWCTDAVAESTFLCEYYLGFRERLDRAAVVPLDEVGTRLDPGTIDLAVNIHSFSEMGYAAIEGWLRLVERLGIPTLLIVPNQASSLISYEADRSRRDFMPLLVELGYRLQAKEPVIRDPDLHSLIGITDHFFLFTRA